MRFPRYTNKSGRPVRKSAASRSRFLLSKTSNRRLATLLTLARLAEYCNTSPDFGEKGGSAGSAAFLAEAGSGSPGVAEVGGSAGFSFADSVAFATGVNETTFGELLVRKCSHRKAAPANTMAATIARISETRPLMFALKLIRRAKG